VLLPILPSRKDAALASLKTGCTILVSTIASVLPIEPLLFEQVEAEKPNPIIFEAALDALGVQPEEAVHVGDDRRWTSP